MRRSRRQGEGILAEGRGYADATLPLFGKAVAYKSLQMSAARSYSQFHNGTRLDINALMSSRMNRYTHLSNALQRLIFEKAQCIIDDGLLTIGDREEMVNYVIYVALNLSTGITRLLQQYDFTKEVPKFVIADTIEDPFSKLECTQLLMLSYLGFDILIYSPSGYRNIETFVAPSAFSTHNVGEFSYNLRAPQFRIPTIPRAQRKKGLFKSLFK